MTQTMANYYLYYYNKNYGRNFYINKNIFDNKSKMYIIYVTFYAKLSIGLTYSQKYLFTETRTVD